MTGDSVQCTKFHLQPLTLGAGKGRTDALETLEESQVGGSGQRTEGTAARTHVLSHSPYYRSHSLRQSTPF